MVPPTKLKMPPLGLQTGWGAGRGEERVREGMGSFQREGQNKD